MFLSRIQLNPHRRAAIKLFASPQVMHAAVLASFPQTAQTENGRVLWRTDAVGEQRHLLVVSPEKPDFTHLVEQAGWPTTEPGWHTREYAQRLAQIDTGQIWGFRLRANPVHSLAPEPGSTRGKRIGHTTPRRQLDWLEQKSDRAGFVLTTHPVERISADNGAPIRSEETTARVTQSQQLRFTRKKSTVTLQQATFEGLLQVTDPEKLRTTLTHGLGPARAYGCGLLTLAPVQ